MPNSTMLKIRLIVTTTLTTPDLYKIAAWILVLGITALFWLGIFKLVF